MQLCQEIADSQRKIFDIEGIKVSVKFEELLNDMKTLSFRTVQSFFLHKCIKRKLFNFREDIWH